MPWMAVASAGMGMPGVQAAGLDLVGPVREQFQKADFDDSVGLNLLARRLQIKDGKRSL